MFTGFNLKYPEYEVITPQTKMSFTLRTLNVQEEERMKSSLVTPTKITEHLNKCIYEALVQKPEQVKDFASFLSTVTLKDREALLYGLYHITYEEIRNYDVRCGSCKKDYPVTVRASDIFSIKAYPGDDILTKKVKVNLPLSPGVSCTIKQPTLQEEVESIKSLSGAPGFSMDLLSETLIIDQFEQDIEQQVTPLTVSERMDLVTAYQTLPARDKRVIYEKYNNEFGQYNVTLKMKSFCVHCGAEEVSTIDLVENFFRMVYSS
jgi:hypothetical protein